MATVTANGREIASKARPGMSVVFPDPCFTLPPPPPPAGTPVPYPNSVAAPALTNGTVTIHNSRQTMGVILRAYFSTSVGDEASMPSPKKGVLSTNTKGSARFGSCSFNVIFEFTPVCRDMDVVTHNHMAILPAPMNTAPIVYQMTKGAGKRGQCKKFKCKLARFGLKALSVGMTAFAVLDYAETMDDLMHGENPNDDGSILEQGINLVTGGDSGGEGSGQQGQEGQMAKNPGKLV